MKRTDICCAQGPHTWPSFLIGQFKLANHSSVWLANQITLKYWLVLKLNNTLWLVNPNPIKWSSRDLDSRESIVFFFLLVSEDQLRHLARSSFFDASTWLKRELGFHSAPADIVAFIALTSYWSFCMLSLNFLVFHGVTFLLFIRLCTVLLTSYLYRWLLTCIVDFIRLMQRGLLLLSH